MKKYIKLLLFIFSLSITLTYVSCTDENKFTNPVTYGLENGAFAAFGENSPAAAYPDPLEIQFSDVVTDPNNSMSSYKVTLTANLSGTTTVIENFFETTSFPAEMSFNSQTLADALGVDPADIAFGDTFNFVATATRNDGLEFIGLPPSSSNRQIGTTESQLQTPGYKSAMQFNFIIACPFDQAAMVGTYSIIDAGGFYAGGTGGTSGAGETFEVIAGSNPNEIILVNPFASVNGNFKIVITVSPFGLATYDYQFFVGVDEVCCNGYTNAQMRSDPGQTSLALSCIGYIDLKFNDRLGVAGGSPSGFSFGGGTFTAQKI